MTPGWLEDWPLYLAGAVTSVVFTASVMLGLPLTVNLAAALLVVLIWCAVRRDRQDRP